MKKLAIALALMMSVSGLVVHAITFGEPDGTRHPYVGTTVFKTASGYYSCSGTLMSSTVFLTAGHCTSEGGHPNLRTWVKFTPSISLTGLSNYASIDAFFDDAANGWTSGDAISHPQYSDFSEFPEIYDVGVVLLDTPVPMSTYGALPAGNFLATLKRGSQSRFTAVGYGVQGAIKPFLSDVWARFQGQVRLVELNSTYNGTSTAKFTNNPGIGGGSCFGDSGGPIFYGTSNVVVAVVSWGLTPCIGADYHFRVDTPVTLNFLAAFLP